MISSVLKDCAILLQGLLYQVFVDVYQVCQVRIANCCYEISNMLFLVIMSLCCVCVRSIGVNKLCSLGYVYSQIFQ
jgi:hypothetical protein